MGKQDVEMTDVTLDLKDTSADVLKVVLREIQAITNAIPGVDLRALQRLQIVSLRKKITGSLLKKVVQHCLEDGEQLKDLLTDALREFRDPEEKLNFDDVKPSKLPEVGFFLAVFVFDLILSDEKRGQQLVNALVTRLRAENRRTLDFLGSRIIGHYTRLYKDAEFLRNDLLALYRTACLRQDRATEATCLNLILRNYVVHGLFEQAANFVSKTNFPAAHTNADYSRYLYYIGRTKSIHLDYSGAHSKLMQAIRKAPQKADKALGFKVAAYKVALVVELLMGEIPSRAVFVQKEFAPYLKPYEQLTKAVRSGSLKDFQEIATKNNAIFKKDGTLTLVNRLHYNVIKTGLRSINLSYSKISLQDVCKKLGLESVDDAVGIVGKAIADGVVNAKVDYENQCLVSRDSDDIYSNNEPQELLHTRIRFCLELHNDCIRNMEYPVKKVQVEKDPSQANKEVEDAIELASESEDDIDML